MNERRGRLNELPFTCRTCRTRYQIGTVRIVGKNCQSCALAAGWISNHTKPPPDPRICANCQRPIAHRRPTRATDGQIVHSRCPTITRAERQARNLTIPP